MRYRTVSGQTLDAIVHTHYGITSGAVEYVLEANPHLADYGAIIPSGIIINLPQYTPPKKSDEVRLWD